MTITKLSLVVSSAALLVSVWTRIETVVIGRNQRRAELARRMGEALVAAQELKNKLSDCGDILKEELKMPSLHPALVDALRDHLQKVMERYSEVWPLVGDFEQAVIAFERGGHLRIKASVAEAKVARFNQTRILTEFDVRHLQSEQWEQTKRRLSADRVRVDEVGPSKDFS